MISDFWRNLQILHARPKRWHQTFYGFLHHKQHLRSQWSHYVVLTVVRDKDIVIKLWCCNKYQAINQKCFTTENIKLLGKHNSAVWHSFWRWTSGLEGRALVKKIIVECWTFPQLSFFLNELPSTSYARLGFAWVVDLKCSYLPLRVAKTCFPALCD